MKSLKGRNRPARRKLETPVLKQFMQHLNTHMQIVYLEVYKYTIQNLNIRLMHTLAVDVWRFVIRDSILIST